jgi:hypothetical protein
VGSSFEQALGEIREIMLEPCTESKAIHIKIDHALVNEKVSPDRNAAQTGRPA